jgi:2-keto-4-pentenoate hydratase/2-oxohepta-3-ene-1,7-dioic acid hydratase in catechol pathway
MVNALTVGKVVCVGRNYAEHARELGNPLPDHPLLFIKPQTSVVTMEGGFPIPGNKGSCHHELEIALLIGSELKAVKPKNTLNAVKGIGLAFDLTLRDLQNELKAKGHPWELAKGFDGACPLSTFLPVSEFTDLQKLEFKLIKNGVLQQYGCSADMLFPFAQLLSVISQSFTLLPGDVVLTGTPQGVSQLQPGDELEVFLFDGRVEKMHLVTQVF